MRKNILILGHNYATQFIDAYNQYTRLFNKDEYEVTVAYLTGEPNDEVRQRTLAENILFLNATKKSIHGLKIGITKKLISLCKNKNYHIVICHRYKPSYIMMLAAQFLKIPALIFVLHELHTMTSINRQLLIACLKRKNMMFAGVSNAVRDDIRKSLWCVPDNHINTLYNVIDVDLIQPTFLTRDEARTKLGLSADDFVFGTIGRLARNKDQESLLQAFARIKQQCPNGKLVIMGDGEYETKLKNQANIDGLENDVYFTGFVSQGYRYIKAFDCFVLPSIQEAFGRVLLEAMLAKLPIIASRVNGIPEVLGDTAILIEPKDVSALANAMQKIYLQSHEERTQAGEKTFHRVISEFSIPNFQQQFWQSPLLQAIKE